MGLRDKLDLCPLQLPKRFLISPSSNLHRQNSVELTVRFVFGQNHHLNDKTLKVRNYHELPCLF